MSLTAAWDEAERRPGAQNDHTGSAFRFGFREGAEWQASHPHLMVVVHGEIEVCDSCVNSDGNPVGWSQTWHEAGRR